MISLLPMAGRGSRFVQECYRLPKPFIPIMGVPMFVASIKSFPVAEQYIFICQKTFLDRYPFRKEVDKYFPNATILTVDYVTQGQACTCLLAEDFMDKHESLLISSIDYQMVYDESMFAAMQSDESVDVIIFTFQMKSVAKKDPGAFAYCRIHRDRVIEVVEKQTISDTPEWDQAVVGSFYYRRVSDFADGVKAMIEKNIRVNNEFYVGTSINQLIERGFNVRIFQIEKFISFGDPFDLQLYQAWEDFFYDEMAHPYTGWK